MDAVLAENIVLCARIWEIIQLDIVLDTFSYETQAVLPDDSVVDSALTDKQFALQVSRLVDQTCLGEAFRIESGVSIYLSPYITSYHFQSMTGPPATPTLKVSG